MKIKAFTLIELLIVVAIIAILAAIAVPNFLEAQTRAKVSRVKADMRSAAIALEAYQVDYNRYPFDGYNFPGVVPEKFNYWYLPQTLSTPVSYVTSVHFKDPFRSQVPETVGDWQAGGIRYTSVESTWGMAYVAMQSPARATPSVYLDDLRAEYGGWRLQSAGPDKRYSPSDSTSSAAAIATGGGWPGVSTKAPFAYPADQLGQPYDPTNGTVSLGDVLRTQNASNGYVNAP